MAFDSIFTFLRLKKSTLDSFIRHSFEQVIKIIQFANFEQVKKHSSYFANFEQVIIISQFANLEQIKEISSHFYNFEQVKK